MWTAAAMPAGRGECYSPCHPYSSCTVFPGPYRHSGAGRNPGNEAEGKNGWQVLADGLLVVVPVVVIPALREWIAKTTGFLGGLFQTPLYHLHPCRRAFAGRLRASLPSRRIQDFLSINDGGSEFRLSYSQRAFLFCLAWPVQPLRVTRCVYPPVVIPAKAGIQEGGAKGQMDGRF